MDWLNFYNHKRLHSTLGYVNSVSLQALSQQLPRRLIELVMPYSLSMSLKAWLAYCPGLCGTAPRHACPDGA